MKKSISSIFRILFLSLFLFSFTSCGTTQHFQGDLVTYRDKYGTRTEELAVEAAINNHSIKVTVHQLESVAVYIAEKPTKKGMLYLSDFGRCEVIRMSNTSIKIIEEPNIGAARICLMAPKL